MDEDKGFSLLLKIIIIAGLLILVFLGILIYSNNLDKTSLNVVKKQHEFRQKENSNQSAEAKIDQVKLVKNYKNNLIKVISAFNGNYQILQDNITNLVVPMGFQDLHLQLVLALNHIIYENNASLAKEKLQNIATQNDWISKSLEKIILNIK